MRIALCDDNDIFLQQFHELIKRYLAQYDIKAEVYIYTNGQMLLTQLQEDNYYFDIIFLDIDMPDKDGIEVATGIRKLNQYVILIFLTSIQDRVYEAFQFNTFRFIRKNHLMNELGECLDKCFKLIKNEKTVYTFKTKEGIIKLSLHDILYFTYINRHVEVKTTDQEYMLTMTRFQDVVNTFQDKGFVLIHRGCIVNVKYIKVIHQLYIVLDNNEKLSISRYRVRDIFRTFTNYAKVV